MARTKAGLCDGVRLADLLSVSLLSRVIHPEQVHAALDAHGVNSQRIRQFSAVAGVYYAMAFGKRGRQTRQTGPRRTGPGLKFEALSPQTGSSGWIDAQAVGL